MKRTALVLVFVLLLSFAAFSAKIPSDTVVIAANTGIFITLDPGGVYEVLPGKVVDACYAKLVDLKVENETLVPRLVLAEKLDISEDGMTYTFTLKDDVKFSNGDPVTVDDMIWTVKRFLKMGKSAVWLLESIGINLENMDQTIQKVGERGVSFTFDKPYAQNIVLGILTNQFTGVINAKVALEHEEDGDMGEAWLADHSAGAGPYVLRQWERNNLILLEANPYYFEGEPAIKRIMIRDVPEASNQRLLVEKGDADVGWNIPAQLLEEMEGNPDLHIVTVPGHGNEYVAMNCSYGPLQDPKVRLAIKWAIDYEGVVDQIMGGYALLVQGFINKGYFGYVPENPFQQNIAKAKQLLAEAGYPDGFEIELMTSTTDERKAEAQKVQADLALVGIKANIVIQQASQMYAKYRQQGHQLIIAGWGNDYPDPDNLAQAHANYRANQLAWRNAWYDDWAADITEAAQIEPDPEVRKQMYRDLTFYWYDNGPFALMYQTIEKWPVRNELKGFEEAAFGYGMVFDFTKLYK